MHYLNNDSLLFAFLYSKHSLLLARRNSRDPLRVNNSAAAVSFTIGGIAPSMPQCLHLAMASSPRVMVARCCRSPVSHAKSSRRCGCAERATDRRARAGWSPTWAAGQSAVPRSSTSLRPRRCHPSCRLERGKHVGRIPPRTWGPALHRYPRWSSAAREPTQQRDGQKPGQGNRHLRALVGPR